MKKRQYNVTVSYLSCDKFNDQVKKFEKVRDHHCLCRGKYSGFELSFKKWSVKI